MKPKNHQARPDWDRMDRATFDQLVEAALHRHHHGADNVWSPNDSGGDGGIDVLVEEGDVRHIYQLKFFPDGLTSSPASRRRQIERSFRTALQHRPTDWTLVIPGKVNAAMQKFVTTLPNKKGIISEHPEAGNVHVHILDRPKLDVLFATYPDLINLIDRDDYLLQAAKAYGQERAVLSGGLPDLVERVTALGGVTADVDPHWAAAFGYDGKWTTVRPVPKHPRAAEVSPIRQGLAFGIPEEEAALAAQAHSILGLGARGTLTVPGKYVRLGDYTGPEFFRITGDLHQLVLMAEESHPAAVDKPVRIVVFDEEQNTLSDDLGRITYGRLGTMGHTLEFSLAGDVTMTLTAPYEETGSVNIHLSHRAQHASPAQVRDGAELMCAIGTGARIEVHVDGQKVYTLGGPRTYFEQSVVKEMQALSEVADDLCVIQRHLKLRFPLPSEIHPVERCWIRALRLALEGRVAPIPRRELEISLDERVNPADLAAEQLVMLAAAHGMPLTIAGVEICLPQTLMVHPAATIQVNQETRTALCTPRGEEVFVLYLPDHLTDTSGHVAPWNLTDIPEPPVPRLDFSSTD